MSAFKRLVLAGAAIGLAFSPVFASAQVSGRSTNSDDSNDNSNFCRRITNIKGDINSKLSDLESNRGKSRTNILKQLKDRKENRSDDVQKLRRDAMEKFEDVLENIKAGATTDAQKAAIETFKTSVRSAQSTRKTAVDKAVQTFRSGVDSLVGKRSDAIKAAASTLKSSISAAVAKAKADCVSGDPVAVRQALMTSIRAAVAQFHADVKLSMDPIAQQIKDLAATRNAAVKAANQAFKAAVAQARKTLKAAFPSA